MLLWSDITTALESPPMISMAPPFDAAVFCEKVQFVIVTALSVLSMAPPPPADEF